MGIKFIEEKKTYEVYYSKRHPITKSSLGIKRIGIKTHWEAKKTYNELILLMDRKIQLSLSPLWRVVVELFLENYKLSGVGQNTIHNYRTTLYAHTCVKWKNRSVNEITSNDIKSLILEELSSRSEETKKSILKYLRAVFSFAVEKGFVLRDPSPKLKFKLNLKIKTVLREKEISDFLKFAREDHNPWYPIWSVAIYTGLRNGELFALKWKNVDFDRRLIFIKGSWNKLNGFKETKSGDDRVIEIAKNLLPVLDDLYQSRSNEFVLPRVIGWETCDQARVLKNFLASHDLPIIRFHDLRASWATVMLSKGVEPIKVMYMGGWKDLKTMQIYVRKSGINIYGITDRLDFG